MDKHKGITCIEYTYILHNKGLYIDYVRDTHVRDTHGCYSKFCVSAPAGQGRGDAGDMLIFKRGCSSGRPGTTLL